MKGCREDHDQLGLDPVRIKSAFSVGHFLPENIDSVAAKLVLIGWQESDIVRMCNATTDQMSSALREFVQRFQYAIEPFGLVYFAGHGLQINEKNYLFGAGAKPDVMQAAQLLARNPQATLFYKDSIELSSTLLNAIGRLDAGDNGALLVVVDACRNDPLYGIIKKRGIKFKLSAPRGVWAPPGIVSEFSTSDGATADDGIGSNSPFAMAMASHLRPDTRIDDILAEVGTQITSDSDQKQVPQRTGYFAQKPGIYW
jgi:Caspase domain